MVHCGTTALIINNVCGLVLPNRHRKRATSQTIPVQVIHTVKPLLLQCYYDYCCCYYYYYYYYCYCYYYGFQLLIV